MEFKIAMVVSRADQDPDKESNRDFQTTDHKFIQGGN